MSKHLYLLFLLCLYCQYSIAQEYIACGSIPSHNSNSNHPDSIYYDMYGNSFDLYPESGATLQNSTIIEKGYYNITLINFDVNLIPTIEQFFEDISMMIPQRHLDPCGNPIEPERINITIEIVNLGSSLGAGSPYFFGNYPSNQGVSGKPFVTTAVYEKINGGRASKLLPADAYIEISSNRTWRNFDEPYDPNNPNTFDLYSTLLHYMMHILASHSPFRVNENNINYYVLYDKYFHQTDTVPNPNTIEEVVEHNCITNKGIITDWLQRHDDLVKNCATSVNPYKYSYFGLGSTVISPYYDFNNKSQTQLRIGLNHFSEKSCNPINWQRPSSLNASKYIHNETDERREFSEVEKHVLCQVGYQVSGFCDGCYVVPYDDYTSDVENPSLFLSKEHCCYKEYTTCKEVYYEIHTSDLLCNDVTNDPNGIRITDVFYNGVDQIDLELDIQNQVIQFRAQNPGTYTIHYTSNACDCKMLNSTFHIVITERCEDCIETEFSSHNLECTVNHFIPNRYYPQAQYSWDFGNNIISNEFSPTIDFGSPGTYSVTLTVTDYCQGINTEIQEVLVDCFKCRCTEISDINVEAVGGLLLSQSALLSLFEPSPMDSMLMTLHLEDQCLAILGTLIIDDTLHRYEIKGGSLQMQPGSSIIVQKGATLEIRDMPMDGGIKSCGARWKGILLEAGVYDQNLIIEKGGSLVLENVNLSDSDVGVHLQPASSFSSRRTHFIDNGLALHFDGSSDMQEEVPFDVTGGFYGNQFLRKSSTAPLSGIRLQNSTIKLEANSNDKNVFQGLSQVILSENSSLSLKHAEVKDLQPQTIFEKSVSGDGIAVIAYNTSDYPKWLQIDSCLFENIGSNSIQTINCNLEVNFSDFINTTNSIEFLQGVMEQQVCLIQNNTFDWHKAVPHEIEKFKTIQIQSIGHLEAVIADNYIGYGGNLENTADLYGIDLFGLAQEESKITIANNIIEMPSVRSTGISIQHGLGTHIENNLIRFLPLHQFENTYKIRGLQFLNANMSHVKGNHIENLSGSVYNSIGILFNYSAQNQLCCNEVRGMNIGFMFDKNCDFTALRHNICDNNQDLVIKRDAWIGVQEFAFNEFYGAVRNENSDPLIIGYSTFKIQTCGSPYWPSDIFPEQNCETNILNWFILDTSSVNTQSCLEDQSCDKINFNEDLHSLKFHKNLISGKSEPRIRIFPNPASHEVNLEILENFDQSTYNVEIVDWNGRVVNQYHGLFSGMHSLSVEHIPNGIYYLRVQNGKEVNNMFKLMILK